MKERMTKRDMKMVAFFMEDFMNGLDKANAAVCVREGRENAYSGLRVLKTLHAYYKETPFTGDVFRRPDITAKINLLLSSLHEDAMCRMVSSSQRNPITKEQLGGMLHNSQVDATYYMELAYTIFFPDSQRYIYSSIDCVPSWATILTPKFKFAEEIKDDGSSSEDSSNDEVEEEEEEESESEEEEEDEENEMSDHEDSEDERKEHEQRNSKRKKTAP
jgi:hypothetical protein